VDDVRVEAHVLRDVGSHRIWASLRPRGPHLTSRWPAKPRAHGAVRPHRDAPVTPFATRARGEGGGQALSMLDSPPIGGAGSVPRVGKFFPKRFD
jgi:hypothetical protein